MKRVLIVASSYVPAMPANVHRARMLAWCLGEAGWEAEVLTPGKEFQRPEWLDPDSSALFPSNIPWHEAKPTLTKLFYLLGMPGIAWRALLPLYLEGTRLLARRHFDIVYITTTSFNLFCLGRFWQRRFGIPYVLDFQDPWYRLRPTIVTTKHWFKFWVSEKLAKYLEAFAVNGATGVVSVSPNYLIDLRERYPLARGCKVGRNAVIPFGVLPLDLDVARKRARQSSTDEILRTIAYVGVGAAIMQRSFRRLADGLARLRRSYPEIVGRFRLRLTGTQGGWNPSDPKILYDEAVAAGIGDLVEEDPRIVSYPVATSLAIAADALLVLGVDDPAYMPSKLFLYALTGKPLLASMHWQSQVNDYFNRFPELGTLIHFGALVGMESDEDSQILCFLNDVIERKDIRRDRIWKAHSALLMAFQHAELFQ